MDDENALLIKFWSTRVVSDSNSYIQVAHLAESFNDFRDQAAGFPVWRWTPQMFTARSLRLAAERIAALGATLRVGRPPKGRPMRAWWGIGLTPND